MSTATVQPPETLRAGPLHLRRISTADSAALAAAVSASLDTFRPWMPWATADAATTEAQRARAREAEQLWQDGSDYIYLGYLPSDPTVIGSFGLHRRVAPDAIELGYWVHAAHVGNGYATHAARALTAVALRLPGVDRVEIHCDRANLRSRAVPERLGYRLDRAESRDPTAPGESGEHLIWITP